jgi:cyclopropane fatty-acyl-phospholipid synthase-like methyltransferase
MLARFTSKPIIRLNIRLSLTLIVIVLCLNLAAHYLKEGGSMDQFYLVLGGHIFFQTLSAAVQLNFFDVLEENTEQSLEELAQKLKLEKKPLRILLLGLSSTGLIELHNSKYRNTTVSRTYMCRNSPQCMRDIVLWQHHINYKALYHFYDAILANKNVGLCEFPNGTENTLYERLTHYPELENIFQRAMQQISVQANRLLSECEEFKNINCLLDVGGGNGSNLMAIIEKNPHIKGIVFDSKTVGEQAREHICKQKYADQIRVDNGDCFKDDFPREVDGIIFCHFFTIWSEEKAQLLLRKAYETLPLGGRCMIFNMLQNDDQSGPLTAAMGSPYFLTLATGEGMLYTGAEYEEWFRKAGFSDVQKKPLPFNHGLITGIKKN